MFICLTSSAFPEISCCFRKRHCAISKTLPPIEQRLAESLLRVHCRAYCCEGGREAAILKLIAQRLSNKEIARSLAITPETVKSHVKHIFIKLGSEKRAQAVARAQSLGLITTH